MSHESKEAAPSEQGDLLQIIEQVAVYPVDAYQFVQEGLSYALERFNPPRAPDPAAGAPGVTPGPVVFPAPKSGPAKGNPSPGQPPKSVGAGSSTRRRTPDRSAGTDHPAEADVSRHITGAQLSFGLREYAWLRWGLLARTVLGRWNITSTLDFGKIVFALVAAGLLSTTESDRLEDFNAVFDFRTLETDYPLGFSLAVAPGTDAGTAGLNSTGLHDAAGESTAQGGPSGPDSQPPSDPPFGPTA